MTVLVSKSKELTNLTHGDKLLRLFDNQVYPIADIVDCTDDQLMSKKKTYYYFKNMGYVRDKVMKKMFKTNSEGFILFNNEG